MALALERRFEPFSQGRGFITPQRVAEIETIAARHGIFLAPLYNADGPVQGTLVCETEWSLAENPHPSSLDGAPLRGVATRFSLGQPPKGFNPTHIQADAVSCEPGGNNV
jgi:hypothetical protein